MKTNTIVIALGATAYASVVRRDATTITGLLTTIHDSMANVDEHLEQYHGGPPIALHQAGSALIQVLKESTETANCIAPLTIEDVISIAGVSQQVTDIGSKFLNELAEAAPLFAENGLCELTLKFTDGLSKSVSLTNRR
ncbi:hypothetical protein F4825DRAFT_432992 [Nemania diffusa]|nr:hypothetical protein F4825DRAFT_432992 [Nemania diffusa]